MAADGSIIIDAKIDTKGFGKGATNLKSQFSGLASAAKKLGAAIGGIFAVRQLVQFGKEAIELGSNLQEVQNVVDVTFGNMSGAVNEFAQNALEQFGLSELAAKQYSSTMGAMLKSMGFTTEQAAAMSTEMAGLAGDMASFYNLSGDDAFAKIRAGISGETEPLKQLGINLSVANLEQYALTQGITKSYNAMTQQEQALLRYNYLLSVTSDAQGDFSRTSESWANQTRILSERFNSLKATIGQGLINALTPVIKVINTILAGLQAVADAFAQFTALLFGNAGSVSTGASAEELNEVADGYSAAAGGAEDLADATEAAGKAAKKSLAGFDEITKLGSDNDNSSAGTPAASTAGTLSVGPVAVGGEVQDNVSPQIEKIVNKIKELLAPLQNIDFTALKTSLSGLGDAFGALGSTIGDALEWAWFNILVPLGEWTIEEALPATVDLFSGALELLNTTIEGLQPLGEWLWDSFLQPIAEWGGDVFVTSLGEITDLLKDLSDLLSGETTFGEFIANLSPAQTALAGIASSMAAISVSLGIISALDALRSLSTFFRDVMNLTASGTIGKLAEVFAIVASGAGNLSEAMNLVFGRGSIIAGIAAIIGGAVLAITNFISMLQNGFSWANEALMLLGVAIAAVGAVILGAPALVAGVVAAIVAVVATVIVAIVNYADEIKNALNSFGSWLKDIFARDWTEVFGVQLGTALNVLVGVIGGVLGGLKEMLFGIIDFVQGVFTGNWEQAWNGIVGILKGAINGVIGIVNGMISAIVNGINSVFRLLSFSIDLPGGGSIGWSLPQFTAPQIPYLAQGAVIPPNAPFMAVLGDQKHGTNVEAPLSTIEEAVANVLARTGGNGSNQQVVDLLQSILEAVLGIELDGETLSSAVHAYDRKKAVSTGGYV